MVSVVVTKTIIKLEGSFWLSKLCNTRQMVCRGDFVVKEGDKYTYIPSKLNNFHIIYTYSILKLENGKYAILKFERTDMWKGSYIKSE